MGVILAGRSLPLASSLVGTSRGSISLSPDKQLELNIGHFLIEFVCSLCRLILELVKQIPAFALMLTTHFAYIMNSVNDLMEHLRAQASALFIFGTEKTSLYDLFSGIWFSGRFDNAATNIVVVESYQFMGQFGRLITQGFYFGGVAKNEIATVSLPLMTFFLRRAYHLMRDTGENWQKVYIEMPTIWMVYSATFFVLLALAFQILVGSSRKRKHITRSAIFLSP